ALAAAGGLLALLVNPLFALVPALVGSGLVFAGVTDFCPMALLFGKLPYNRVGACDVNAVVAALKNGEAAPVAARGSARAVPGGPGACCACGAEPWSCSGWRAGSLSGSRSACWAAGARS